MNKRFCMTAIVLLSVLVVRPLAAQEVAITGDVRGIELCPQFICGAALFTGVYRGSVDGQPAVGTWFAAVKHDEELPDVIGDTAGIRGGTWQLNVWVRSGFFFARRQYSGVFTNEGVIELAEIDLLQVTAPMVILDGGRGGILLNLDLDESTFPQPVWGTLTPIPPSSP
jgi:hypothetical protein